MSEADQLPEAMKRVNDAAIALMKSLPAPSGEVPRDLIKAMAEAVGKNLAAYVEVMYPEAMKAASSTFKLSLKNHVYNDIMHVTTLHTEAEIRKWLTENEAHHKQWLAMYRKMRRTKSCG